MKIGSKISLFYTLITVCIIAVVVVFFYFFTSRYINKLYNSYLTEKAFLTAQKHWEKDEVDEQSYRIIQQKYNELLPQAQEILLNMNNVCMVRDTLNKYLDSSQQKKLFDDEPINFAYDEWMGAAIYYPDNEGNFIVLVMARNHYGYDIQKHILLLAVLLLLVSSILIFLIGKLYANKILHPLQHLLKELKRIRGNNLNLRMRTFGNKDELDDLIRTLNEMLDRIDAAFRSEKSFINSASHELNNPLTAIQGECEISLMKERSTNEYIESLQRISTESKRLSMLIKQLLFLSRQEEDLLESTREEINLETFLHDICADNTRIDFSNRLPDKKKYFVHANFYLFKVAVQNLIDNACKYSKENVFVCLTANESNTIIEIIDHGIGIPADEIQHIFQSFYRASNTREFMGQGIGLSLSMKILSAYKGKISIDSKVGKYTRVYITFS